MIPAFARSGSLPPGIHSTTWEEFVVRFGQGDYRMGLIAGLKAGLDLLQAAGCQIVYVDGSFVTAKEFPGDFDVCWELQGVDRLILDPVFLDFSQSRAAQKAKFGGEFFPAEFPAGGGRT